LLRLATLLSFALVPQMDPVGRLATWIERARAAPGAIDVKRQNELRAILGDLRVQAAGAGESALERHRALVALASLEWRSSGDVDPDLVASARLGRELLEAEMARPDPGLAACLAFEVLEGARKRPRAERLLAAQLLERVHLEGTETVLCSAAREGDGELARAALAALAGWDDAEVHLFFLERLEGNAPGTRAAAQHFEKTRVALGLPVLERLQQEVARRIVSDEWRTAVQALPLARALDTPRAAPILIEALATWTRRAGGGNGSRRMSGELVSALQERSGRALGAEPERWSEWWKAVCEGRIALPEEVVERGGQNSSAAFFGLQAATDRVVFVVDRSGSMKSAFGTSGRTRHAEAIDQLVRFLRQSGEETRFSVALFSDEGVAWRSRLVAADRANLEAVTRWLESKPPEGETRLYEGVRAGLGLDPKGRIGLERCEADTVIVLCDGATTEGPGWVARWLGEENEKAQLVFHCVQIGEGGNGTLEALASGTGGRFVRVKG
jgi:hypothetical protein